MREYALASAGRTAGEPQTIIDVYRELNGADGQDKEEKGHDQQSEMEHQPDGHDRQPEKEKEEPRRSANGGKVLPQARTGHAQQVHDARDQGVEAPELKASASTRAPRSRQHDASKARASPRPGGSQSRATAQPDPSATLLDFKWDAGKGGGAHRWRRVLSGGNSSDAMIARSDWALIMFRAQSAMMLSECPRQQLAQRFNLVDAERSSSG